MPPGITPPTIAPAAADEREFVETQAIRAFLDALPGGLASGAFGALVIAWMLAHVGVRTGVIAWTLGVLAAIGGSYLAWRRYRSAAPDAIGLRRWGHCFIALSSVSGLAWGSAAYYFLPGNMAAEIVTLLGVAAIVIGGLGQMAAYPPVYFVFMLASELPFAIVLVRLGDPLHTALAAGVCALMMGLPWFAIQAQATLEKSLTLAFRNRVLADALAARSVEAENANLAKSRFVAVASHDLRQPVHSLRVLLDLLAEQRLACEPRELVLRMRRATDELDAYFDELLDISKLDTRTVQVQLQVIRLDEFMRELHAEFAANAEARNLRLALHAPACSVISDPLHLQRIVRNLLSNALQYTQRGGILMAARRRRQGIAFEIWDTGSGISLEEQAMVFEPFYQGPRPAARHRQGLGLGLAIVHGLAHRLEHPLELRSRPGRGTCIRMLLPSAPLQSGSTPTNDEKAGPLPLSGFCVVVVDAAGTRRPLADAMLRKLGASVTMYGSGAAMLSDAEGWSCTPDLVIWHGGASAQEGQDEIAWLREQFNALIPALVIDEQHAGHAFDGLPALRRMSQPVANEDLLEEIRAVSFAARGPGIEEHAGTRCRS